MELVNIRYEGGKASGFSGAVPPNCHTIFSGQRGQEEKYVRTDRTDHKGWIIFTLAEGK